MSSFVKCLAIKNTKKEARVGPYFKKILEIFLKVLNGSRQFYRFLSPGSRRGSQQAQRLEELIAVFRRAQAFHEFRLEAGQLISRELIAANPRHL